MSWTCGCGQSNEDTARFCNQCGAPKGVEAPPAVEPEIEFGEDALPVPVANLPKAPQAPVETPVVVPAKKSKALVIILVCVALFVVGTCVLGILAAIFIPNFVSAKDRAKQSRAMTDIQAIAAACQQYQSDKGTYPDTGHNEDSYYSIVDVSALKKLLPSEEAGKISDKDPWGHPYSYGVSRDGTEFILICSGSDGVNKLEKIPDSPATTSCFEDEIVWENGNFIQKPLGPQKHCK